MPHYVRHDKQRAVTPNDNEEYPDRGRAVNLPDW